MEKDTRKTQISMILRHLQNFGSITTFEAFEDYGCTRLSGQIFILRKRGYHIITERMKRLNRFGNPCNFAKYLYVTEDGE